jgi:hypothetical protein
MTAASYDLAWLQLGGASSVFSNLFYDGTYVWFTTYNPGDGSYDHRLWKMRHSDKALIKPDGTVGNTTNASQIFTNLSGYPVALVSNGTNLVLTHGNGFNNNAGRVFLCSNMSDVQNIPSGGYPTSPARNGILYNGIFYFPGTNSSIVAINPSGWGVSIVYTSPQGVTGSSSFMCQYGGYVYLCNEAMGVEKIQISNWTRVWVRPSISANGVTYDPIRDEVWLSTATAEALRIRGSDGAILNRTAAVDTLVNSVINSGTGDSKVATGGNGILCYGDVLYGAESGAPTRAIQRRSTSPTVVDGYGAKSGAYWYNIAQPARPQIVAGSTIYFSMGGVANIGWLESDTAAPVIPNLTDVSPGTGPHISLTFDNMVTATAPTLGPASGELGVSGASQISPTQVDIACVVTPVPPKITTARANTSGIDLIFDKAVDLGATPDYGTTVGNLKVVTAAPVGATEVQLYTTVTSGTYEWLSTPIVVTGVGVLPHVVAAWAESNTTFVLIFNEAVIESSAINIANYAISPALDIISIEKMDSITYRMHTSQQTGNTTYYVTLTGVIDPANNPI